MVRFVGFFAALSSVVIFNSCTSPGNAKKVEEVKYDYEAGRSGEDKVLLKDDNAIVHSDRNAVQEYNKTVDLINNQRQVVEGDLVALNTCRKRQAAAKNMQVSEGQLKVECMAEVVKRRDSAGTDLVQLNGKLVLRKQDDFKERYDQATSCLDQMTRVRDMAREAFNTEDCDK